MAIAMAVSICFFSNQTDYVGVVPKHVAAFGDLTFEVGFVLAALLYALFFQLQGESSREEALVIPGEAAGREPRHGDLSRAGRSGAQEGDRLLGAVPDHGVLGRGRPGDHLAAAQHQRARRDQAQRVGLGRRVEDDQVGRAARRAARSPARRARRPGSP